MPREAAAKLEVAPGRQAARQSTGGGENRGRSWRKGKRAILQFLKIPGTKL